MKTAMLAAMLCVALSSSASAESAAPLVTQFMQAWNAADAKTLGALFAPDADLVTPTGIDSKGRDAIEAFYAAAFARGYAGSRGVGQVVRERALSPDISLIDARFAITNAKTQDGSSRAAEGGIMTAVVRRTETGWQILALRENEGASDFTPFPPSR
jgi:uncharacterized protein (TIGR02246 family)